MRTIILPGMGADSCMYPKESYKQLSWVTFADWPAYNGENTIEEVAQRVIKQYKINQHTIVGGSSLGGMVAVQISKFLKTKKIILIGSTVSPEFINPLLKRFSGMTDLAPVKLIQLFAGKFNFYGKNDLLSMFEKADNEFIKAMCRAVFNWNGIEDYRCEICHIHGAEDKVIFPPKNNAEIIYNGGHLISMTHSDIVSNFIEKNTKFP